MGSAEKINSFNSTSELQLGALMDEKLNQAEIERINDRKAAIWQQVQKAAEFSDREKNEIKTTLETGLKDDSINAINTFSAEIERRRKRIGQMVDTYFGTLDQNKQYFAKREGYDA
ncbi:hypothetical protein KJ951_02120, partial [Patescibacteria group bacterium]|nr:hypothetical protein [Patescibacteria group bacterium]MBU1703176.1 hypothetical protein [Patescibacteria group bacterium]MBU1953976.1 hypothetical protein [Patescibacteria group bacterium]